MLLLWYTPPRQYQQFYTLKPAPPRRRYWSVVQIPVYDEEEETLVLALMEALLNE